MSEINTQVRLSAEGRTALRSAITNHANWNSVRKSHGYSLATMSRTDYLDAARHLDIDVNAIVASANSDKARKAADVFSDDAPKVTEAPRRIREQDASNDSCHADPEDKRLAKIMAMLLDLTTSAVSHADAADIAHAVSKDVLANLKEEILSSVAAMDLGGSTKIELTRSDVKVGELKGRHHPEFSKLLRVLTCYTADGFAPNVWIAGPAGSGKTTAARNCAKALEVPFHFNGAIGMPHELLGFIDAGGTYHRTPFRDAYEHGGVYLFDEVDGSDNSALLALNAALANGVATFPDGVVMRHEDCRIIAAANTWGFGGTADYVGRAKIDGAFLDRFAVRISWDYDEKLERDISGNVEYAAMVQRARAKARAAGLKVLITPRATMAGAALVAGGFSMEEAAAMTYLANLSVEQRAMVAS